MHFISGLLDALLPDSKRHIGFHHHAKVQRLYLSGYSREQAEALIDAEKTDPGCVTDFVSAVIHGKEKPAHDQTLHDG